MARWKSGESPRDVAISLHWLHAAQAIDIIGPMGIIIDYHGKLDDLSRLDELVCDVKDFCRQVQWKYREWSEHLVGIRHTSLEDWEAPKGKKKRRERSPETHPDEYLELCLGSLTLYFDQVSPDFMEETMRGIYCYPPGTESVNLVFDSSGNLCSYLALGVKAPGKFKDVKYYSFMRPFTKTTGCVEEHIRICKLLRMIQAKHMPKLVVTDHAGYFETLDEKKLMAESLGLSAMIGAFRSDPSLLKTALNLPKEAEVTDITHEFNESQQRAAAGKSKAAKKGKVNS